MTVAKLSLSYYMKYIQGSIFINNFLSAVAEFLGYIFIGLLTGSLGLKIAFSASFAISGTFALLLIFANGHYALVPVCVFAAKFGVSAAFSAVYMCNPELFPPDLLSTSYAASNVIARGVTVFAPMVAEAEGSFPLAVFCGLCMLSMALVPQMEIKKVQIKEKD